MTRKKFCGGWVTDPSCGGILYPLPPAKDEDPRASTAHRPWNARNGMPEVKPYAYRRGEAEREAEIAALVAEARRQAEDKNSGHGDAA